MRKKILIVDDSKSIRQQVAFTLNKAGYTVVEAEDGNVGHQMYYDNKDIAMVICDINMPELNGIELLEKISNQGPKENVPIIMLTTEGSKELIKQAKSFGAKGWMVKPFQPEQLVAAVAKLTA